jgi:hypothetical protein
MMTETGIEIGHLAATLKKLAAATLLKKINCRGCNFFHIDRQL